MEELKPIAVMPGIPDLRTKEKEDRMPSGFYSYLRDTGCLVVQEGVRVSSPGVLLDHLESQGIQPGVFIADKFAEHQLTDLVGDSAPLEIRRTRWSEATDDISAFRKFALNGLLSVEEDCRPLVTMALSQCRLKPDDSGSFFLKKRQQDSSRDDVAQALVLACGGLSRYFSQEEAIQEDAPMHLVCQ